VLTFAGAAAERVGVHIIGNRIRDVTVQLTSADRTTVYATVRSSASTFSLPPFTLPATGTYAVVVDPIERAVGVMNVAVAVSLR
jgi:hypothetical protein